MILHSSNHQRFQVVLSGDAVKKRPQPFLQSRRDPLSTFLGAKDAVKI
jgi:hypothetical protein